MSWNAGQIAECINDDWGVAAKMFPWIRTPKIGQRARVTAIMGTCECGNCFVWLRLESFDQLALYASTNFRPVVEDKPQVSEAYQMLLDAAQKVTIPKREDVKAWGPVSDVLMHGAAVLRALRARRGLA